MQCDDGDNNEQEKKQMETKTDVVVKLTEEDGNAFYVLGKVSKALKRAGHHELAEQYLQQATSGDYDNLLRVTQQFVTVE
jgi:cobalamin biosynthesis Co2+ chelatase CbiK